MKYYKIPFCLVFLFLTITCRAQSENLHSFRVVPLGVEGGLNESNLSSYMLAAAGTDAFIGLDAGTLFSGLKIAVNKGVFRQPLTEVLRKKLKVISFHIRIWIMLQAWL